MLGVDAAIQIPFLGAIISGIITLCKWLWEMFGRACRNVAIWMATFLPWLVAQAARRIAVRLLIVGVLYAIMLGMWTVLLNMLSSVASWTLNADQWLTRVPFIAQYVWESPMHLKRFIKLVVPASLAAETTARSIRFAWFQFSWARESMRTA